MRVYASMSGIFSNTGLDARPNECPDDTVDFPTGYESSWDGHFSCTPKRTVTYDCGQGNGTAPEDEITGDKRIFAPAENTCTAPNNHQFSGWLISGTDTVVQPNRFFVWTYDSDKTLTAQWESVGCPAGEYLDENTGECEICAENNYCVGEDTPMQSCPEGLVSPVGTTNVDLCSKILRVDEDTLYLTQVKQTSPALGVKLDGKFYYAKMEPLSEEGNQMNSATNTSLRTKIDGVEYYIHDNTIQ